ncbi:hypothetical protein GRI39_02165 [Altererythrobacter indicus]|uniref:Uncharacterized protein n=1 Tax=Altericroceibacterium indicum TaxID=374177 RepID=A0A845A3L9_9SPHN|nr:hypothetical protein [Altericroceibacterium indicum]MXP24852.1 hypothetical protein [Altericroceibacterium indicum]
MNITPNFADGTLKDAIWWFYGFEAAQPYSEAALDTHTKSRDLAEKLNSVCRWLSRLAEGKQRVIGVDERTMALAITEHEMEALLDGLKGKPSEDDRALALKTIEKIFKQYRDELTAIRFDAGGLI